MVKHTGRFVAKDSGGKPYTVDVFTEFVEAGDWEDEHRMVSGVKSLRLLNGELVGRKDKGQYELLDGTPLTSDDPAAP